MDPIKQPSPPSTAPDSRFIECRGFRVHYKQMGSGRTLILLLHGSFLSLRSWRAVIGPLAARATVVALDRPAFGLTSRPLPKGRADSRYSAAAQSDLIAAMIERLGFEQAVLIGNSTGGTLALLTALRHPSKVQGLVLVDAMIYSGYATSEIPAFVRPGMRLLTPVFSRLMGFLIRRLYDKAIRAFWHDPTRLSDAELAAIKADMMTGPWARAFWELFLETRHLGLDQRLAGMQQPALVITGAHDQTVKTEDSERLARELPNARLAVIPDCAHLPQEEAPEAFVAAVEGFLDEQIASD